MTNMTYSEAEGILDIVSSALQEESHPLGHRPVSTLRGHDLVEITTAINLRIANELLLLARRNDFEDRFRERVKFYERIPWQIMRSFVADDAVGKVGAPLVMNPVDGSTMKFADARMASLETPASFGEFCVSVGTEDPDYWQKVYARIRLEHTSSEPKGNTPIY